jgi:hypothetical protein
MAVTTQSEQLDLLSLLPRMDLTRRAMIVPSLATDFALAVQPVSAQTDYRPSYNAADAQDGWKRMLAWFNEHGVRAA